MPHVPAVDPEGIWAINGNSCKRFDIDSDSIRFFTKHKSKLLLAGKKERTQDVFLKYDQIHFPHRWNSEQKPGTQACFKQMPGSFFRSCK